jgi:orotate phosphoribosyltransferase
MAANKRQTDRRARLRDIVGRLSVLRGGDFRLTSGRRSSVFFNMKMTLLDPEGADLVAEELLDLLADEDVELIGGIELGAVPLIAVVCVKSAARGRSLPAFIVRKRAKGHGTDQVIEGFVRAGARAIVFDDVTTTGGSVLQAAEAARAAGCRVAKAVTIVDRLEGAAENLAKHGLELVPLFTKRDFAD